jgi:hypothetical protein
LQVHLFETHFHASQKIFVIWLWQNCSWELIISDVVEQRKIVRQKLSQVDIVNGSEYQNTLILIHVLLFEVTCGSKHRLDSSHSIVIMLLGRKLLRAQGVCGCDLKRKGLSISESEGIKRNLSNHSVVGHHHSHSSEQSLQVIWKLRSSSISWIHCNEDIGSWNNWNFSTFEEKSFHFLLNSLLDTLNLLSNDREYLKIDSVELIETNPAST